MGCASSTSPQPYSNNHRPPPQSPARQPQNNVQQAQTEPVKMKAVKIDQKILDRYIELEQQTHQFEGQNVLKAAQAKEEELTDLEQRLKQLKAHHQECCKQTAKEKNDVDQLQEPSVKNFFKDQAQYETKLSKEEEEYLDALNRQEIALKDVEGGTKQRDQVAGEVKELQQAAGKLQALYKEQDELLAGIFDGKYGSELEFQLESQLDTLQDRKQRISVAKYKWTNARVLLQYAVGQLAVATKMWEELGKMDPNNMQVRYTKATETRNNLIAANQNIVGAQRYLHTIQFPYCKADEMTTLTKATNNIYTDMQDAKRHAHAGHCYSTTHKRASALLQWFDQVINSTINKDLEGATEKAGSKDRELRNERLRLIKEKIKETTGKDVDIGKAKGLDMGGDKQPQLQALRHDVKDKVSMVDNAPNPTGETGSSGAPDGSSPLPLNELAPPPKQDDLFGDIEQLKQQHERELEEFSKAQEVNKTRMEQGLQEKLRARRSRKNRLQAQEE